MVKNKISSSICMALAASIATSGLSVASESQEVGSKEMPVSQVSKIAAREVSAYLGLLESSPIKVDFKFSPGVNKKELLLEKSRLSNSLKFWSKFYSASPTVIFYEGKDFNWLQKNFSETIHPNFMSLIKQRISGKNKECQLSLAAVNKDVSYFVHCIRSGSSGVRMAPISAHEFAHLPHAQQFQKQSNLDISNKNPTWLVEGSADFFGMNLTPEASKKGTEYWNKIYKAGIKKFRPKSMPNSKANISDWLASISPDESVQLYTELEDASGLSTTAVYALGRWAIDYLIATEGLDRYFVFLSNIDGDTNWKESFSETFGIDIEAFYGSLVPYLHHLFSSKN